MPLHCDKELPQPSTLSHIIHIIHIISHYPHSEEVEVVMSLDQRVSIQGQELADAANEVRLTAAKIHFMDIFE